MKISDSIRIEFTYALINQYIDDMPDSLPNPADAGNKYLSISETARELCISIDTVRRWDRTGTLHSIRLDGKNRYFLREEIEKLKSNKTYTISEVAQTLGISISTLRRIDKKGLITTTRNSRGERLYTEESIQEIKDLRNNLPVSNQTRQAGRLGTAPSLQTPLETQNNGQDQIQAIQETGLTPEAKSQKDLTDLEKISKDIEIDHLTYVGSSEKLSPLGKIKEENPKQASFDSLSEKAPLVETDTEAAESAEVSGSKDDELKDSAETRTVQDEIQPIYKPGVRLIQPTDNSLIPGSSDKVDDTENQENKELEPKTYKPEPSSYPAPLNLSFARHNDEDHYISPRELPEKENYITYASPTYAEPVHEPEEKLEITNQPQKSFSYKSSYKNKTLPKLPLPHLSFNGVSNKLLFAGAGMALLFMAIMLGFAVNYDRYLDAKKIAESFQKSGNALTAILGETTEKLTGVFNVYIPTNLGGPVTIGDTLNVTGPVTIEGVTNFNNDVLINGNAPLTGITAGSGISVTGTAATPTVASIDTLALVTGRGATTTTAVTLSGGATIGNSLNLGQLSSDPTGTNGAIYYNTSSNLFRCYQNGSWKNCDTDTTGGSMSSFKLAGSSGTDQTISDGNTLTIAAGNGVTTTGSDTDTLTVGLDVTTTSTTTTTSANSGLEISSTGLSLLRGCSASQILKWNAATSVWECSSDADTGASGISKWTEGAGILHPNNNTLDLLIGGTSSASAKFAVLNVNSGTTTASVSGSTGGIYLTATGNLQTTAFQTLALGGSTTGNITATPGFAGGLLNVLTGNLKVGNGTPTVSLDGEDAYIEGTLEVDGAVRFDSTTTLNTVTYTWPGSDGSSGQVLTTNGTGTLSWGSAGTNFWDRNSGALYPNISTLDLFVGGTTTASAKFGFLNVNSGTPTASISAGTAGAAYLTAAGNLQTTAAQNLVIGGSSTGNIVLDSGNSVVRVADLTTNGVVYVSGSNGTLNSEATLDETRGGTGLDTSGVTDGQLLIGNDGANGFTLSALTAGSGITITNGAGAITIAQTGSGASKWVQDASNGTLFPNISTLDLLVGGVSTTSAKFAVLNVAGGIPTASLSAGTAGAAYLTAAGNLQTTAAQNLVIGGSSTGNIVLDSGNSIIRLADLTTNGPVYTSGSNGTLNSEATLDETRGGTGQTTITTGDLLYGSASNTLSKLAIGSDGQVLTVSSGIPAWASSGSINFWQRNLGALAPDQITNDLLLGGTSTTSAKFAFINNIGSGTPTASISAGAAGALSLNATGTIGTTVMQSLTLGGATTGNIVLDSGNSRIQLPDFTGNNAVFYATTGTGVLATAVTNTDALCLMSSSGTNTPAWTACPGSGSGASKWTESGAFLYPDTISNQVGIGTTTNGDVISSLYVTRDLASGALGKSLAIFNQTESQDIFTASASGTTRLTLSNGGNLNLIGGVYQSGGTSGQTVSTASCVTTTGGIVTGTGNCPSVDANFLWQQANGLLYAGNTTVDLAIGGTASTSAKFAVLNVASGTPTASVSAGSAGAAYLNATGSLTTTAQQTLTLGGATTGDVLIQPNSDTGDYFKFQSDNTNLTLSTTDGSNLTITPAGTLTLNSTGLATIDSSTDISLDADGEDIILLDAATEFARFTNSSTDLTINVVDGQLYLADADTINIGGVTALAYNALSDSGGATGHGLASDDDLYIEGDLEVDGTIYHDGNLVAPATGESGYWQRRSNAVMPTNITDDLLLGATASSSARFAVLNIAGGTPTATLSATTGGTYLTAAGKLSNTNKQPFTFGDSSTGDITITGNKFTKIQTSNSNGAPQASAIRAVLVVGGNDLAGANTSGNFIGVNADAGYGGDYLNFQTNGTTTLRVVDGASMGDTNGVIFFGQGDGNSISSISYNKFRALNGLTLQGLNGSGVNIDTDNSIFFRDSSSNNKFSFLNIASGTPTASVSANSGNNAFVLTGTGILSTTNRQTLTLGDSSTGDINLVIGGSNNLRINGTAGSTIVSAACVTTTNGIVTGSASCPVGSTDSPFQAITGGIIVENNTTQDLLLGGLASSSARFAVLNVAGGTPTATLSAGTAGGAYLNASGTLQTTARQTLTLGGNTTGNIQIANTAGTIFSQFDTLNSRLGLGTTAPIGQLHVTRAMTLAANGKAVGIFDQNELTDIFTASASGTSRFTITNAGGIKLGTNEGTSNYCLLSGGAGVAASWAECPGGSGTTQWNIANGTIYSGNTTLDLLMGGVSSASAKFAVLNVNSGTPTASLSAGTAGGAFLNATGTLTTTARQELTIGDGNTVGNVTINSTGNLTLDSSTDIIFDADGADIVLRDAGTEFARLTNSSTDLTLDIVGGDLIFANDDLLNIGGSGSDTAFNIIGDTTTGADTNLLASDDDLLIEGNLQVLGEFLPGSSSTVNGFWRRVSGALSPYNITDDLLLGSTASSSARFAVLNIAGGTPTATLSAGTAGGAFLNSTGTLATTAKQTLTLGNSSTGEIQIGTDATARTITLGNATGTTALAFNSGTGSQTFTSQVATGITTTSGFVFDATAITTGTGVYLTSDSITQGKLLNLAPTGNTLTTGTILNLTTTATSLTGAAGTGSLVNLDWSPGSATTATGDLFALNIGTNGTTTGNLFNVLDAGSSIFSVSETQLTSSLPVNFTAAGDVSIAYDIVFTNPTASYIKSAAPLYLEAGEIFNSSDLTLRTYNQGSIIADTNSFIIGSASAAVRFGVSSDQQATAAALIENIAPNIGGTAGACNSTNCHTGLMIKLGVTGSTGNPGDRDRFINFQRGDGLILGKIRGNGTATGVVFDTTGGDYAEWFRKDNASESFDYGDLVCMGPNGVTKCSGSNSNIVGVISDTVGFVGNSVYENDSSYVLVGMLGQVKVKVSSENGEIKGGDPLSFSPTTGVASKTKGKGFIVGKAIDSYTGSGQGKIRILLSPSWYDPHIALSDTGNLSILPEGESGNYIVMNQNGDVVDKKDAFSEIIAGTVQAGKGEFEELVTGKLESTFADFENLKATTLEGDSITITDTLSAGKVETDTISSANGTVEVSLKDGFTLSLLPLPQGEGGGEGIPSTLFSIDQEGNASVSGSLTASGIKSSTGTIDNLTVKRLTVDEIEFTGASASALFNFGSEGIKTDFAEFDLLTVNEDLTVLGTTTLNEASVATELKIGNDLTFGANSLNTIAGELEIQPLQQQAIAFMGGAVRIETDGTLKVNQNAEFAKDVKVQGVLSASAIKGINDTLSVSGSAQFEDSISSKKGTFEQIGVSEKGVVVISPSEVLASGSAGLVKIPANRTQIKINNEKVKEDSLIFITPKGSTFDTGLFIKEQVDADYFIVGVETAVNKDIEFNFLIVE